MAIRIKAEAPAPAAQLPGAVQVETKRPEAILGSVPTTPAADYKAQEKAKVRGMVRMHAILAALQSPAGPAFAPNTETYTTWLEQMADLAVKYTFTEETK